MSSGLGRDVRAAYRHEGAAVRTQVAVRWATCPFDALAAELPPSGRILEVGCGHGAMALAAALGSAERFVVGTDVDAAKLAVARRAAEAAGVAERVELRAVDGVEVPAGPWDAVVVVDVLYLLERDQQQAVVAAAAAALAPDGVLLVKETAPRPRWKARLSALQEHLAVRVARWTASEAGVPGVAPPEEVARWAQEAGLDVRVAALDRGYHVPHALVVARRAATPAPPDRMRS